MKKISLILLAVMLLFTITSCGTTSEENSNTPTNSTVQDNVTDQETNEEADSAESSEPVVIKFWSFHGGTEAEFLEEAVGLFNKNHTDRIRCSHGR